MPGAGGRSPWSPAYALDACRVFPPGNASCLIPLRLNSICLPEVKFTQSHFTSPTPPPYNPSSSC
jgi:hypothetical protein